jgi:hypothetical protein
MTPDKLSAYQLIWLTDRQSSLSYTIINYDKLGFDAADFGANSRNGRCQVGVGFFYSVVNDYRIRSNKRRTLISAAPSCRRTK